MNEEARQHLERMEQFIADEGRRCSVAQFEPVKDETWMLTSRFLAPALMRPEEEWPRRDGRCLTAVLNIRFDEVPFVPGPFRDLAWATLYLDVENIACHEKLGNGNWDFRTYKDLCGLVERSSPEPSEKEQKWTSHDITWVEKVDVLDLLDEVPDEELFQPPWQTVRRDIPSYVFQWMPRGGGLRNQRCTKLGGFPTRKQWNVGPSDPRNFLLQITSERAVTSYDLCDCAISYLGEVDGELVLDTQTS